MKRIINILLATVTMLLISSCNEELLRDIVEVADGDIVLEFRSEGTKAEDTEPEAYISHIDVMIFNCTDGEPATLNYHERISVSGASSSVLSASRADFEANTGYYVQVVANSTADASEFGAIEDYNELINIMQEDPNIHLTGLDLTDVPAYFLMDGVAYIGSEPAVPGTVVLNDDDKNGNTDLTVTLERAAAKVVVNIASADNENFSLAFTDGLKGSEGGLYYIRNLPYETFVIDHDPVSTTKLTTSSKTANAFLEWHPADAPHKVTLVTYVYAHDWNGQGLLENEPCIIMNLPSVYHDKASDTYTEYPNSWYKIPMSADNSFDRNMYYEVNITINMAGATSMTEPETVEDIYYQVQPWNDVNIYVGGESNRPRYLTINRNTLEMSNVEVDEESIEFSSSSEIVNVSIDKVWFIDKFGAEQNITSTGHNISVTTDSGLNGKIRIYSPKPTNNTIRYITFTITNADGDSRSVTVTQYPLEYITNKVSWYSYRSDFIGEGQTVPTTYENLSRSNNITSISYNGNGIYTYNSGSAAGFFRSKFVSDTYSSYHSDEKYRGRSNIDSYYWNNGRKQNGHVQDPGNARMYHIRIMASSGDYTLGKPKITDGITDPGADNAEIVSPSFMIASRLAVITTNNIDTSQDNEEPDPRDYGAEYKNRQWNWDNATQAQKDAYKAALEVYENFDANDVYLKIYAEHCKQYVEVYDPDNNPNTDNAIHYDDWRLPTAAELKIIYKYQGNENESADAIDFLLNAGAYFSASGPVANPGHTSDGTSVRCIRDAY